MIVNPGKLEGVIITDDRSRFAYAMVILYHVIAILILLNLTITLMNATIQKFQNRQLLYWKCEVTSVWIEFFDCPSKIFLPIPFSAILVFWTLICLPIVKCWRFCSRREEKIDSKKSNHLTPTQIDARRKHAKLMQELIMRLIKKNRVNQKQYKKRNQGQLLNQEESRCSKCCKCKC